MSWREAVIAEAKTWMATPYHSGAKVKGVGVDCGQLLIGAFENAGVINKGECNPGTYSPEWHLHRSEELYRQWIQKYCDVIKEEPLPGDIAVFRFGRCDSHAGIVVKWPVIIHAYIGMGVVLSDYREALLCHKDGKSRLAAIYRLRG